MEDHLDSAVRNAHTASDAASDPSRAAGTATQTRRRPRKPMDPTVKALWETYTVKRDEDTRNLLTIHYAGQVKSIATRIASSMPQSVGVEDLMQYGMIGLMDAIAKFDPERDILFETYSSTRITGAIYDELRAIDPVSRATRAKIKGVAKAQADLEHLLGRTPSEKEIADHLGESVSYVRDVLTDYAMSHVSSIDALMQSSEGDVTTVADRLPDDPNRMPGVELEENELAVLLRRAIGSLGDRDRIVLNLYYFEQLTLAEIGEVLGVTESRICQLRASAQIALGNRLVEMGVTPEMV